MGTSALPYGAWYKYRPSAKDDINNVGAGRAAKGATLVTCFLSPFSPVLLVVAVNTIRNPIVFRAKIGQTPPLLENRYPEH